MVFLDNVYSDFNQHNPDVATTPAMLHKTCHFFPNMRVAITNVLAHAAATLRTGYILYLYSEMD